MFGEEKEQPEVGEGVVVENGAGDIMVLIRKHIGAEGKFYEVQGSRRLVGHIYWRTQDVGYAILAHTCLTYRFIERDQKG